jgi:hypothetical protein
MGSRWFTGGVAAAPHGRIQFDFVFEGIRYRPTIRRPPSEANLRRARERLEMASSVSTEARVAGIDRNSTKTGEDRRVELCPRALAVLKRQLRLRARLVAAGKIDHDHVFFQKTGELLRNLQYPQTRWRRTLTSLKLRYRKPYCARHSSVSWNLMAGRNALWVSKQHGHSVYAAWAEGAVESDIKAIKRAMRRCPVRRERVEEVVSASGQSRSFASDGQTDKHEPRARPGHSGDSGSRSGSSEEGRPLSGGKLRGRTGGERGIRTLEGLLTLTPLAGVRLRPLGHLSVLALKVRLSMTYKLDAPCRPCGEHAMILKRIGKGKEEWRAGLVRGVGCARTRQTRAGR